MEVKIIPSINIMYIRIYFKILLSQIIKVYSGHTQKNGAVSKVNYQTPWPEPASECHLSADRGCHVVNVTNPYGRNLGFLNQGCHFFFQVAPQLYSRG
jgi:hypothetical protein